MHKVVKAFLLSAAATGVAALLLSQLDLDAARPDPDAGFPGPDPEDIDADDVETLLNELAAQL
ncbi:MAG: hypothetical protein ABEL04_04235 [Salinibacter sp.]|uniref:hypothetical protein n=1 Tax=Salinibacter sp. TaxID=2065818 RepID=UPI0035D4071D